MNLKHLTDKQLLFDTKVHVSNELESMTLVLHYLKEVESRKLFSELKYPSMFEYAVKELKYSEPAAGRRIQAARLMTEIPCIEKKISKGILPLTNINLAARYFRQEKIKETSIKKGILEKLENKSTRECEKILFELTPKPLPKEAIQQISKDHVQLKINVTDETHKKLDEVKSILGFHVIDNDFFSRVADEAKENLFRKRFKLSVKGRETISTGLTPSNYEKRTAYESTKDKVCEKCGGLFLLQEDHRIPKALGGSNKASNLRLLCFHCNQRQRIISKL